jgi:orotate phosphoribosyltransferase
MDSSAREQLLDLLATVSFRLGEFTLSSGAKSDYYIDCRTTTLHAEGAALTGRVFLDLIRQQGWQADAVGGLTMGADPFLCAKPRKRMAWAAALRASSRRARAS